MAFFRRIRSPREPKHERDDRKQMPNRSYSTSAIHATANGHRRHKSNEVEKIENVIYSEPNVSSSQEQSWRDENPPLPPRNRPASYSVGHSHQLNRQVSDEECYVAPADTLVRKSALNPTQGDKGGPIPTQGERKQMHMHHVTLSQKAGHRRTHSFGQVIDNSDYSTPWNLIQQGRDRTAAPTAPPKPPKGRDRSSSKMVVQSSHDGGDNIIPVMSPPPIPPPFTEDRSLTNSPSSPVSSPNTPTSEHPPCDDYDEPWDKKFKDLHMPKTKPPKHHSVREKVNKSDGESDGASDLNSNMKRTHSPKPPERHPYDHHHDHPLPPHPPPSHPPPSHPPPPPYVETEIRPRVGTRGSNRGSPPTEMRSHSGSRGGSERHRLSPQPDHEQRPRLNTRNSERVTRDRSVSPIQPLAQSWSVGRVAALRGQERGHHHDLPGDYVPPGPPENLFRSSSVSIPMSSRRLPSPPPPEDVPQMSRTNSPPCAHIDISTPLDEQL